MKKWPGRLRGGKINETEEETQTRSLTERRLLDGDNGGGACRGNNIGENMFGESVRVFRGGPLHHLLFFIKFLRTLNNPCELRNTLSAEVIISLLPRFNVQRFIYAPADFGVFMLIKNTSGRSVINCFSLLFHTSGASFCDTLRLLLFYPRCADAVKSPSACYRPRSEPLLTHASSLF